MKYRLLLSFAALLLISVQIRAATVCNAVEHVKMRMTVATDDFGKNVFQSDSVAEECKKAAGISALLDDAYDTSEDLAENAFTRVHSKLELRCPVGPLFSRADSRGWRRPRKRCFYEVVPDWSEHLTGYVEATNLSDMLNILRTKIRRSCANIDRLGTVYVSLMLEDAQEALGRAYDDEYTSLRLAAGCY